jgi:hypothetical protein
VMTIARTEPFSASKFDRHRSVAFTSSATSTRSGGAWANLRDGGEHRYFETQNR